MTDQHVIFTPQGKDLIFDDTRTWVDPNGYRLSDRLWRAGKADRAAIDTVLRQGLASGNSVLNIAKQLEDFLTPTGRVSRTRYPTGSGSGNAAARTLARTEANRAFNQGSFHANEQNPFVDGMKWNLSGTHHDQDHCSENASGHSAGMGPGEYQFADFPTMPDHPNCRCYMTPVTTTPPTAVLEDVIAPAAQNVAPAAPADWVTQVHGLRDAMADATSIGPAQEAALRAAGKLIREQIFAQPIASAGTEVAELEAIAESARLRYEATPFGPDRVQARFAWDAAVAKAKAAALKAGQREVLPVLKQTRSFGSSLSHQFSESQTVAKQALAKVADTVPTTWWEKSVTAGPLKSRKVERGYYQGFSLAKGFPSKLYVSGWNDAEMAETAIHEFGHRMEHINDRLLAAEKAFYERRTAGEALAHMPGYPAKEKSRADAFKKLYIGKDYGGHAYEVLSMGIEDLLSKQAWIWQDEDMADFILGAIAVL